MCTCSSMLSLKFFVYSKYYSAHSENRDTPSGRLQEVKNNGKSLTVRVKKWSRSLTEGSFTRGSNCKALTGEILVFWIGGRLWELVTYEWCLHMEVRRYLNS